MLYRKRETVRILLQLALAYCCVLSSIALGQSGRKADVPAPDAQAPSEKPIATGKSGAGAADDVLRVRTEEIMVPVSVRDFDGKPVGGLTAERFMVYDNGVRQEIASFNRRRVPANIVLLLDASGSVFQEMSFIRAAAKGFVDGLLKEDRVSVMQFADRVELLQDWTGAERAAELYKALDWRYHPGQSTAFYDGLYLAAEEQLAKTEGRRIIVLLTDGIDTCERRRASFEEAVNAVRRAEASVYVVSLTAALREYLLKRAGGRLRRVLGGYDPREVKRALALIEESEGRLDRLSAQTGGRMFLPKGYDELLPAYRAIAEELRTQYIITYRPRPRAQAGEWRRLRVLVLPGGYEVGAREGYRGRS